MEKLYTVSKNRLGANCGSDHELLIAKFRLKLNKVGKTSRPFRYDLNQIPYDYNMHIWMCLLKCVYTHGHTYTVGYIYPLTFTHIFSHLCPYEDYHSPHRNDPKEVSTLLG